MVRMNKYRIVLSLRAKNDILNIGDYISLVLLEPDISRKFVKNLRYSISQLKIFPYKYSIIQDDNLKSQNVRCMPYKNYYIFYEVLENKKIIIILRVGYKNRNWGNILK